MLKTPAPVQPHLSRQMAGRAGVLVVRCNESYTSKTCPDCGHIHEKLGGEKTFRCPQCGFTADRDAIAKLCASFAQATALGVPPLASGARNIMLRALQATAFTINSDAILISDLCSNV